MPKVPVRCPSHWGPTSKAVQTPQRAPRLASVSVLRRDLREIKLSTRPDVPLGGSP